MNDFTVIYRILNAFHKAMDEDSFNADLISAERLKISKNRRRKLLIMLIKNGYIENAEIKKYVDEDTPDVVLLPTATITLKGLEYLEDNSMMKKAKEVMKDIKEFIPGL